MKPTFAWVGGAVLWSLAWHAVADCRVAAPAVLVERVFSAQCASCWADASAWSPPSLALVLDWVVPADDDAPLQAVALLAARARWPEGSVPENSTTYRVWPLLARPGDPQLLVQDGPAWSGYMAVAWRITRPRVALAPTDWSSWMAHAALVEQLAPGDEGSVISRQVVRAVAGPLSLSPLATQHRLTHLQAMRLPEGGQPGRWKVVGWLTQDGEPRVAAWAAPRGCPSRP